MKIKLKLISFILTTGLAISSCGEEKVQAGENIAIEENLNSKVETEIKNVNVRSISDAKIVKSLETITCSNIRCGESTESNILTTVNPGTIFNDYVKDGNWYKIGYKENIYYIHEKCVKENIQYKFPYSPVKKVYLTDDINLTNKNIILPKFEVCDVYEENNGIYMISTDNYVGYISSENTEELKGKYVVVDISDQELKLYNNLDILVSSPVVTGLPTEERESDIGCFEIYSITHNRDLVGPNYRSYVDVMMSYNGGEGLHDAEYHVDENGKKHGWRDINEFGGNTYLTNGSHGCINMPHDNAILVSENVEIGTKVLVKK